MEKNIKIAILWKRLSSLAASWKKYSGIGKYQKSQSTYNYWLLNFTTFCGLQQMANTFHLMKHQSYCGHDSRITNTPSQFKCVKKISLQSCRSMVSIEDNNAKNDHTAQRALFLKYLLAKKAPKQKQKYLLKLRQLYKKTQKQKVSWITSKVDCKLNQMPSHLQESDREVFSYFMAIWIDDMGYRTTTNKNYILAKLHERTSIKQMQAYLEFYETLGQKAVHGAKRFRMLEEMCESGWEFFIGLMLKYGESL